MRVYEYVDYRRFLIDYIALLPKKGRGEIRRMADQAGVHSSLLSQILSGAKNLSLEQAQMLSEYLDLTPHEHEHFMLMVQYQRAGTVKLQDYFKNKIVLSQQASSELGQRVRQDRQLTEEEKSIFYSHWLYVAIWLLTSVEKGKTLVEVSAWFNISRGRASEILQFLVQTQMCEWVDETYKMGSQSVHLARGSPHLARHHASWRLRAIEASDQNDAEELFFTSPISISKADFKKIRTRLADIIKEVTEVAIRSEAQEVACFNMDFFRVKTK